MSDRLFFGVSLQATWPEKFPKARILKENERHFTLGFIGGCDLSLLEKELQFIPECPFEIGCAGVFDKLLFLPKKSPKVVAYHARFFTNGLVEYQKKLFSYLQEKGYLKENDNHFLPHVTVGRKPEAFSEWKEKFLATPFLTKELCLYKSLGNLKYEVVWRRPFILAIEEISHTADIAYIIRASDLKTLFFHAQLALCFADVNMIPYIDWEKEVFSLDDIVIELNHMIARADCEMGSSFKAVSFHGKIREEKKILVWEMVVDV